MQPRSILHSSWAGQKHALDQWRRHGERPVNGCVHGCQQELFHRGSTNGHWKMTLFWRAESANETFCSSLVILRIRNTSAEATSENFRVSMMSTFINCRGRQVPCLCPPLPVSDTTGVAKNVRNVHVFTCSTQKIPYERNQGAPPGHPRVLLLWTWLQWGDSNASDSDFALGLHGHVTAHDISGQP